MLSWDSTGRPVAPTALARACDLQKCCIDERLMNGRRHYHRVWTGKDLDPAMRYIALTPQQVAGSVFAAELVADRGLGEDDPEAT